VTNDDQWWSICLRAPEYAEKNKSDGLTTMRRKHVALGRGVLRFDFTGKSGKQWKLRIEDKRIAAIVKRCAEIPRHELFKYLDADGQPRTVDSGDVNAYIKDITGEDLSAKDWIWLLLPRVLRSNRSVVGFQLLAYEVELSVRLRSPECAWQSDRRQTQPPSDRSVPVDARLLVFPDRAPYP
jgi:hypothetical protein